MVLIVVSDSVSLPGEDVASIVMSASVCTSLLGEDVASIVVSASPLGEGVVLIVVSVSVSLDVAGVGFTIVVFVSFFSAGELIPVCFCSQPTSNAAPAAMSMYFLTT